MGKELTQVTQLTYTAANLAKLKQLQSFLADNTQLHLGLCLFCVFAPTAHIKLI